MTTAAVASVARGRRLVVSLGAPRAVAVVRASVLVAAAAPIAAYLWVALHRVGYPYELDWMEGGSVELAARVAAGHPLYAPPSLAFVGWTYTPLYYWTAAAVSKLTGVGFLPLRLVSLTASLAVMAILARTVARETRDRIAGLLAAGLFAAAFRISGAWFDVGRVDSLFLALTLLAVAWGARARTARGGIALGVIAFLAFFTKQTALVALAPALAYLLVARRRVGIPAVLTLAALLLASTAVLDASSGGWYRYYVFSELAHQPWAPQLWLGFWWDDILGHQWPAVMLIAAAALVLARRRRARAVRRSRPAYYAAAALGLICSAWVSRLHTGGYANVLMPAYAALALLTGLTYGGLLRGRRLWPTHALLAAMVLLQFGLLVYPPAAQIPTAADRVAGAQLISRLRALPGPVVVLRHPWYGTTAGKGSFAHAEAIGDVLRSGETRGTQTLRAALPDALDANHIQALVVDGSFDASLFGAQLRREFRLQRQPITPSRLYPLTDLRTAPTRLYLRVQHVR